MSRKFNNSSPMLLLLLFFIEYPLSNTWPVHTRASDEKNQANDQAGCPTTIV
jgi:hypothetical protein